MAEPLKEDQYDPCGKKIDASNIPWTGPAISCLNICKGDSMQDVMVKEGNLLCQIVTELNTLDNPPTPPVIDFTKLNFGCLYSATVTTYNCPCISSGKPAAYYSGAPITMYTPSTGFCYDVDDGPYAGPITCTPVATVTANPVPAPNTLLGVLQLILSKVPCCNPCSAIKLCCPPPYIWLTSAATGNPTLYPNGACAQTASAGSINPAVLPYKC